MGTKRVVGSQLLGDPLCQFSVKSALDIDSCQLLQLMLGMTIQLVAFDGQIGGSGVGLRTHRDVFAGTHRHGPANQSGNAGKDNARLIHVGGGDADYQTCG